MRMVRTMCTRRCARRNYTRSRSHKSRRAREAGAPVPGLLVVAEQRDRPLAATRMTDLPDIFTRWFESRGWAPRAHQLDLLEKAHAGRSALLIAPTGAGKTLAGFLPSWWS